MNRRSASSSPAAAATCRRSSTRSPRAARCAHRGRHLEPRRSGRGCDARGPRASRRSSSSHRDYAAREAYDAVLVRELRAPRRRPRVPRRLHAPPQPRLHRRLSERDPQHPPVAAAVLPRRRRAAPGAGRTASRYRAPPSTSSTRELDGGPIVASGSGAGARRRHAPSHWRRASSSRSTRPTPRPLRIMLDGAWRVEGRRFLRRASPELGRQER